MKLYLIPGMGVDHRLYLRQKEEGLDFSVIEWKRPYPNESMEEYAQRMSEEIKEDKFILGGVSLGGVMASEIAKIKKPEKLILISTIKTGKELPPYLQILRKIPLHRLIPTSFFNHTNLVVKIIRPVFGAMNKEEKEIFEKMIKDSDPVFIKWSIDKILNWDQEHCCVPYIHIHGTADAIFPIGYIKPPVYKIDGGSHIMICSKSSEINKCIKSILKESLETTSPVS